MVPHGRVKDKNTIMTAHSTAVRSQKGISAYFTSKQILPSGFAESSRTTDKDFYRQATQFTEIIPHLAVVFAARLDLEMF